MKDAKYRTLVETLKKDILNGKYNVRNPFPSMRALISRFNLSKTTVQHALDDLAHQGLISRKQGRGTFVTGRSGLRRIGLIVPGFQYAEFLRYMVKEISRLCQANGYSLLFGEVTAVESGKRTMQAMSLAKEFVKQGVSGVVLPPIEMPERGEEMSGRILSIFDAASVPVVLCDNDFVAAPRRSNYDVIGINNVEAGVMAAQYLRSIGARNIHFLLHPLASQSHVNRLRGAIDIAAFLGNAARRQCRNVLISDSTDERRIALYLKRERPDAFICGNDENAIAFKKVLDRLGYKVPEDIMLLGFDDISIAQFVTPALTTVHQPCKEIAEAAFHRLLERIANPMQLPQEIFLPVHLVVRESTRDKGSRQIGRKKAICRFKQDKKKGKTE